MAFISGILHVFGIVVGLIILAMFVSFIINNGFSKLFDMFKDKISNLTKIDTPKYIENINNESVMKPINILKGKCDRCGKIYITTTEEENTDKSMITVTYQGTTRNMCKSCANTVLTVFNDSNTSKEVVLSSNIKAFKNLFK